MYVDYKEMGKRIASRRRELGLKQRQVNELAELSDKYLSNIETARSVPSIDVLVKICKVLKTTPDYILLGCISEEKVTADEIAENVKNLSAKKQKIANTFVKWLRDAEV